ncbi:MAG: S-layer homology domain-containing protein, partial [Desulfotomaculaceae bacterium]
YYNPSSIDSDKVDWSASPDAGRFRGSIFTPAQSGTYTIRAELGSAGGTTTLRVIGPESIAGLIVNPAQINVEPGQSVQLSVQVKTYTGEIFDLLPGDVDWTVDSFLGSMGEGKFTAANDTVSGTLKADFQGITASVPVSVKPPWVDLQAVPNRDAEISMDSWIKIAFPAGSLSERTNIRLAYAPAPSDLAAGINVLGTCTVNPLQVATALDEPWDLDWQYSKDVITSRPAILLWDSAAKKWRELPARIDGEDQVRTISARLWGFGKLVLVDDTRKAPVFKDTAGHWASAAISRLALSGVAKGFPDGTFGPGQPITRAQFVSLLAAALQWPAPENQPSFDDAIPQWAQPAIAAAVSRGVVNGYPDGTFAPDARVTRSEMAVMIDRALDIGGTEEASYKDSDLIPAFALDDINSVTSAGILQGSNGYFRPRDGATRAETAVAIDRVIKWWANQ